MDVDTFAAFGRFRFRRSCPNCGAADFVEEELPNINGRLDVFAPDSGQFRCSPFGPSQYHGCGYRWSEKEQENGK